MSASLPNEIEAHRQPDHEINPQFLERWSPRSFSDQEVSEEVLLSLFEAARMGTHPEVIISLGALLLPVHLSSWLNSIPSSCRLIVYGVKRPLCLHSSSHTPKAHEEQTTQVMHSMQVLACGYLALEANNQGLITHAMGGFEREQAREALQIPAEYELHAVVAIGYRGPANALPENLQEREVPPEDTKSQSLFTQGNSSNCCLIQTKGNTSSL